jgi:hypothetical protein
MKEQRSRADNGPAWAFELGTRGRLLSGVPQSPESSKLMNYCSVKTGDATIAYLSFASSDASAASCVMGHQATI